MKVLLLLFSLFFTISCSLSEETQQTSELNVSESTVSESTAPIFNGAMNSRMVRETSWNGTIHRSDTSGSGWMGTRKSLKNNAVWNWLIASNEKRHFNYYAQDGTQYWFSYTFFQTRNDVWYTIVRDGVTIQTGWTTVKLLEKRLTYAPGRYSDYGLITFDVQFHPETHMNQTLMVQIRKGHRAVTWAGGTEDFGLESSYNKTAFERGSFHVNVGHISGKMTVPVVDNSNTSGSDWRDTRKSLKNNAVWNWLLRHQEYSHFNYYTSPNGSQYWLNFIFDHNSKAASYTVVRDGRILQTGSTTVTLLERRLTYAPGRYSDYGLIKFDVKFNADTHMKQILMVQIKKGHRGVIWAGGTEDFGLESVQNKIAFERGGFHVNKGAVGVK